MKRGRDRLANTKRTILNLEREDNRRLARMPFAQWTLTPNLAAECARRHHLFMWYMRMTSKPRL